MKHIVSAFLLAIIVFLTTSLVLAAEKPVVNVDRYQISQSTILAKSTFSLDTSTGKVWLLLVVDTNEALSWQQMPVEGK